MQLDSAVAPVRRGDILNAKYRIEDVIGVGGMGVVVSAMHLELDQRVALKFLLPQAQANAELVGRFVREAKASIRLKGEHVTKVLDVGRMDDGRAYIVMEFLEGRDLGAELKAVRENMPVDEAVGWMLQACEGLAEAHALGIVHRDLKPGNLFLTKGPDQRALVKVLDFGISKSINPNSSDMLSLTRTEMLLGSPLYMAPEQMRSSKYVDERSDIWALGAIAYELIARRVPFEAETLLDLCFKVAQEGCPALVDVRPEVPDALSEVVMRCLQKEPENRWHDVGELALAFEPFAPAEYAGSAERTIAVLNAGGDRARARRTEPARRSYASLPIIPIVPIVKTEQIITGASKTERYAVSQRPSELAGSVADPVAATTDSTTGAVPASSAWGKTSPVASEAPAKKSNVGLALGAVIAVAVIGYFAARTLTAPPPVATNTTTIASAPPVVTPPEPKPTAVVPPPVIPTPSASPEPRAHVTPRPNVTPPRPKPSLAPSASATANPEPQQDGDFIKTRE